MKLFANYHTHTWHCGHAEGTPREYVESAIAEGVQVLGFTDHAPYAYPNGFISNHRMTQDKVEDYFYTLTDLKKEYADQIQIHIGVEAEYYPELFEQLLVLLRQYPCEYMLLGQHYIGNEYDDPIMDSDVFLRSYVDQILEGLSTGLYTYLAHPDYAKCRGDDATVYRYEMERLCRKAKEMGIPLEINLNGMRGRQHYPSKAFWQIVGEIGNDVVIGTDHHYPEGIHLASLGTELYNPAIHYGMDIERQLNEIITECNLNVIQTVQLRPIG